MCYVAAIPYILTAVTTAATMYQQSSQASANAKNIEAQNQEKQNEIEQQAGNADTQAAMEARQARAQSTVAAGAAGVNLGSNSFLASLQTTTMNQSNQAGLVMQNEQDQQLASTAETNSSLAEKASSPSLAGALIDGAIAEGGTYMSASAAKSQGQNKTGGVGAYAGGSGANTSNDA